MEYWIDGYNVIFRTGLNQKHTLEKSRERLLSSVLGLRVKVRVWFDARGGNGLKGESSEGHTRSSLISARYVSDGTADDAMIASLRKHGKKGDVTLVTDDRELRGRARQLGANTLGVTRFVEKLDKANAPIADKPKKKNTKGMGRVAPGEKPDRVSGKQVDEWLDYFGFDDEELKPL